MANLPEKVLYMVAYECEGQPSSHPDDRPDYYDTLEEAKANCDDRFQVIYEIKVAFRHE